MRTRLRDLDICIGTYPTGACNAITDVPGILVGHTTIIADEPRLARTGVTVIVPRDGEIWHDYAFAGYYAFNGYGDMTGLPWIEEAGVLGSAVAITNSAQVGLARDSMVAYAMERGFEDNFMLPVATETYDGWLNDIYAFHVTREHVFQALDGARGGPVAEGSVGGGTGMICYDLKGGIGTSSRRVKTAGQRYTVGVLVQANHGDRPLLRVDGVPVGRYIDAAHTALPWETAVQAGSIIVVVATDAPLLPLQCRRLAQRATVGLARTGGIGHNKSGDLFLALATGNHLPARSTLIRDVQMLSHNQLNPLFEAVAEATEEAILNCLTAAETMTGYLGRTAHALPLDELQRLVLAHRRVQNNFA
jgi:D-aminopeptidase